MCLWIHLYCGGLITFHFHGFIVKPKRPVGERILTAKYVLQRACKNNRDRQRFALSGAYPVTKIKIQKTARIRIQHNMNVFMRQHMFKKFRIPSLRQKRMLHQSNDHAQTRGSAFFPPRCGRVPSDRDSTVLPRKAGNPFGKAYRQKRQCPHPDYPSAPERKRFRDPGIIGSAS